MDDSVAEQVVSREMSVASANSRPKKIGRLRRHYLAEIHLFKGYTSFIIDGGSTPNDVAAQIVGAIRHDLDLAWYVLRKRLPRPARDICPEIMVWDLRPYDVDAARREPSILCQQVFDGETLVSVVSGLFDGAAREAVRKSVPTWLGYDFHDEVEGLHGRMQIKPRNGR